jgi:hypothetical protein
MTSIIHDWAARLGLRHQGVLVSAIRGCDSALREDPSKYLVRVYRGVLLRSHCGDVREATSFMVPFDKSVWIEMSHNFFRSIDHYPNHWLLHWAHACEIVGFKHPDANVRWCFSSMYHTLVRKFHMHAELEEELDARLDAPEHKFAKEQI